MVMVWRDHTTLQVGLDEDVLVLGPVPRRADTLVRSLTHPDQGGGRQDPSENAWRDWLRARLDEHGHLAGPRRGSTVRVLGTGPLAARISSLLLDLGHRVLVKDPSHRPEVPSAAERLVHHLRSAPGGQGRRAATDGAGRAVLTIVCTGMCEPDRSLTDELTRERHPYLVLRTRPGTAVAGPLVVPGRTSCLRCSDLWRTDADPVWPRLAAQLAHRQGPDDPVLDTWVTAVALAQVVAFLNGEDGELRSRTLTLAGDAGRTTLRSWPPHPRCTCHHADVSGVLPQADRMGP
jgi:bacteriocin biosynthesis cyclodehydratase domain-containing protein